MITFIDEMHLIAAWLAGFDYGVALGKRSEVLSFPCKVHPNAGSSFCSFFVEMGVAQNSRARVTRILVTILVFGSTFPGAMLVCFEPSPLNLLFPLVSLHHFLRGSAKRSLNFEPQPIAYGSKLKHWGTAGEKILGSIYPGNPFWG